MSSEEIEPLWRDLVGDTEPWRRGRLFLILLAILTFCFQALSFSVLILTGDIQRIFGLVIFALLFWLQYYFIWIGVHWVRWLNGGLNALSGFAFTIWGLVDGVTFTVILGLYSFCMGAYLALAPSVYFFAQRQRETVRWMESLIIGAVFLVLLASLSVGVFGLLGYKKHREREAREFADTAFRRIFADHDTYFLLDRATDDLLQTGGGRAGLSRFMQDAMIRAGDVHEIQTPEGGLRFWYFFPLQFGSEGRMSAKGVGSRGPVRLHLRFGEGGADWKIDGVWWIYSDSVPRDDRR